MIHPGRLHLGQEYDFVRLGPAPAEVLLTARTLTEHALSLGGTPEARAERALLLLEQTLLQGIPCIVVDTSGFTQPLTSCLQDDGQRQTPLHERAHIDVYTPGSEHGPSVSLLPSFRPPLNERARRPLQGDELREPLEDLVSALLALAADAGYTPSERDRALLQLVLEPAWRADAGLTPALVLRQLHDPPVRRVGAVDLDSVYPPAERAGLSLALSRALSHPLFADHGGAAVPLEIGRLVAPKPVPGRPIGKTRAAILRAEALAPGELGCLVTLLLSAALRWARAQAGAPVLRLLVYLDEGATRALLRAADVARHSPLHTVLNPRRPTGLGVVMALSDADLLGSMHLRVNTWLVGRLADDASRRHIAAAFANPNAGTDRDYLDATLSELPESVFLLHTRGSVLRYVYSRSPVCSARAGVGAAL